MAELADAQDLESCGRPCGFNSRYLHQNRQISLGICRFYFALFSKISNNVKKVLRVNVGLSCFLKAYTIELYE